MSNEKIVPSTAARLDPVVKEARERWNRVDEWEASARSRFLDDLRFAVGDSDNGYQWPNAIRRSRDMDSRPCLTMNLIRQHNLQISNESRKNKAAMKFVPLGNGATADAAKLLNDVGRRIEYISRAQSAYTTARAYQIAGGIGWWRLGTAYVDDATMDQDIFIWPVNDPLSVYLDVDIQQRDGSDAKYGLVFDTVPKSQFDEAYPRFAGMGSQAPLGIGSITDDWVDKDYVRVCEYFRKVSRGDRLFSFVHLNQRKFIKESLLPEALARELALDPMTRIRDLEDQVVEWKLIVGERVVDETIWPGEFIPLIRVIGEEHVVDGQLDRIGHTRGMKDAQRMYNYNAALALDTPVPTPSGWTTMGLVKEGDMVLDHNGAPVPVKKVLPVRVGEPCFKIKFDNGHSVVTDAGHIWQVEVRGPRYAAGYAWYNKTVSTAELAAKKHFINIAKVLKLPEIELPIDPYLLGTWLGDGTSANTAISCHTDDIEEQRQLIAELGYTVGESRGQQGNGAVFTVHGVRHKFTELGLLGDKHIPVMYLRAARQQRLALLQGLMDTDGHYAKAVNQCIFVNSDSVLASGFLELCATLGIKTTVAGQPPNAWESSITGKTYISKKSYRIQFTADPDLPVFRLVRKAIQQTAGRNTHWRRTQRIGIVSVEPVESVPVRCLTLDTPEHLFLVGQCMIPTHNSAQVEFVALQGKTPWVAPAKSIEQFESMWNTANLVNHSVLVWNHVDDDNPDRPIPPPFRAPPPTASPAYESGMNTAFNQMMMVSGQWQNQMGMMGNERTGKAIDKRLAQADTATFHFQDNYELALQFSARQILGLIPKIYDTRRVLMITAEDGTDVEVELDPAAKIAFQEIQDNNGRAIRRIFNPQLGKYDVAASFGPAYGSKREATVEALTLVLTQAPALTGIIGDLLLSSMDFDKAQEAAQRLRRMIPPEALGQGPSQSEQEAQARVQALTQALAESLQEQGKTRLKLTGKDQARNIDAYRAETERVSTLLPTDPAAFEALVRQLVSDAMKTSLAPIIEANADDIGTPPGGTEGSAPAGGGASLQQPNPSPSAGARGEAPPMPRARKAPDGQWYIPDPARRGKYLRVSGPKGGAA